MELNEMLKDMGEKIGVRKPAGKKADELIMTDDPIQILTSQHREVDAIFEEIEGSGERAFKTKEKLVNFLAEKVNLHTKLEEKFFYPRAKHIDKDLVLEAAEEHRNVKSMLKRLTSTDPSDETFDAQVTTLKEMINHHVKEEENELFPKCRESLSDQTLCDMSDEITEYIEKHSELESNQH